MSGPVTVPMIAPDGSSAEVPVSQIHNVLGQKGQIAVHMQGPDGSSAVVPIDQYQMAISKGAKVLPGTPDPASHPAYYGFTPSNLASNAWQGVKGLAKGAWDIGSDLVSNPNWVQTPPGAPPSTMDKFVIPPMLEESKKAAATKGAESLGHSVASGMPLVGPWAAGLGEQAGSGDIGGAAAQAGAQVAVGAVAPKVIGKVSESVGKLTKAADTQAAMRAAFKGASLSPAAIEHIQGTANEMGYTAKDFAKDNPEAHINAQKVIEAAKGNLAQEYTGLVKPIESWAKPLPPGLTPELTEKLAARYDTTDSQLSQRIRSNQTTVGDNELIRGEMNRIFSDATYTAPEVKAMEKFGRALRDSLYQALQQTYGLPQDTINKMKDIQGGLIESQPKFEQAWTKLQQRADLQAAATPGRKLIGAGAKVVNAATAPARALVEKIDEKAGVPPLHENLATAFTNKGAKAFHVRTTLPAPPPVTALRSSMPQPLVTPYNARAAAQAASPKFGGPQATSGLPPRGGATAAFPPEEATPMPMGKGEVQAGTQRVSIGGKTVTIPAAPPSQASIGIMRQARAASEPVGGPQAVSGRPYAPGATPAFPQYLQSSTPLFTEADVMEAAKSGRITPAQANARLKALGRSRDVNRLKQ